MKRIKMILLTALAMLGIGFICFLCVTVSNREKENKPKRLEVETKVNKRFKCEDYYVTVIGYTWDKGTRYGSCELLIENADGSNKEIVYDNLSCIPQIGNCISFGAGVMEKVDYPEYVDEDGKLHVYANILNTSYDDRVYFTLYNNESLYKAYNYPIYGEIELQDSDGLIKYVECDNGYYIYISDKYITIEGKGVFHCDIDTLELEYIDGTTFIANESSRTGATTTENGGRAYCVYDGQKRPVDDIKYVIYDGTKYKIKVRKA